MYLELNLSEEGAHLAGRAQKTFLALGMGYEAAEPRPTLRSPSPTTANWLPRWSFSIGAAAFDRENNRAWIATIDLYQALVHHRKRRLDEALELCRRAIPFFEPSPLSLLQASSQLLLARILLDRGESEEGQAGVSGCIDRLEEAGTPALSYQAWYVLGVVEESPGAPEAAYQAYLKAHGHLENGSNSESGGNENRLPQGQAEIYEALVRMSSAGTVRMPPSSMWSRRSRAAWLT
jgi:tetratricopeptide (TPR) repeat protein